MDTQKGFKPIIIALLFAAIGLSGTWFLYSKNQSLEAERTGFGSKLADRDAHLVKLKNEKKISEQELVMLKASDIAKEVEFLRLKLHNTEGEFTEVKQEIIPLEAIMIKIRLYADVIAAFDQNLAPPPPTPVNSNLKSIDIKINALDDGEIAGQWGQAKLDINAGGDGANLIRTYFLVISKIRKLLP